MRRTLGAGILVAAMIVLAACAVLPHNKDDATLSKVAATDSEAQQIVSRYRSVRATAIDLLDAKPLSVVEGATVLAIDSGSFEISQRSARNQSGMSGEPQIKELWIPVFSKYPVWFVALVEDSARAVVNVQVFARDSAATPWLLEVSPKVLATTALPEIAEGSDDAVITVSGDNEAGMALSPQEAVDAYVAVLNDPEAAESAAIVEDGFIRQMRLSAAEAKSLDDVKFSRAWAARDVEYALRTDDGGALIFATLTRQDAYAVQPGLAVRWPKGSPQQAFLGDELTSSGTLNFYHQILMYLPGGKDAKPRVLGQYGGVVGAEGA